jgi:hypothetical protein
MHAAVMHTASTDYVIDGGVLYRTFSHRERRTSSHRGHDVVVCEVLFLATAKHAERQGSATRLVDDLEKKLAKQKMPNGGPADKRLLCVSIKSSDVAESFWRTRGMKNVEEGAWLWSHMIKFKDFTPVFREIGEDPPPPPEKVIRLR